MPIPLSTRFTIFLVAGAAGIAGASCNKSSNESPRIETAAAAAAPAQQPPASADTITSAKPQSAETPQPETTRAVKPARKKPVVEPAAPAPKPAPAPEPAQPADSTPAANAGQEKWLSYDAATNTVTFELIGGPHGFQFNGYAGGGATLTLPSKANVVINFTNKDGTPHSAEIISGEGPLPNAGVDPAIPRAYTSQLLQGLPQEGGDVMRFQVPESGTYRIFCGVPGHGVSMWIWMKVDPSAKAPSFGPTKT
jgi:outer membrane biosynthesis protein TonB